MEIGLGILLALAVFFTVVLIHELGHFVLARMSGAKVEEFGIGIPPRAKILGTDRKGTMYSLNWLPIGGFVRLKGEDPGDLGFRDKDAFSSRPFLGRIATILAGVTANFLLAWVILSVLFWSGISPVAINTKFETLSNSRLFPTFDQAVSQNIIKTEGIILDPIPGAAAEKAGLKKDDKVLAIGSTTITSPKDFVRIISQTAPGSPLAISVLRDGWQETILVTPESGKIGAYVGYKVSAINPDFKYSFGLGESIMVGAEETWAQTKLTFSIFSSLIKNLIAPATPKDRTEAMGSVGGPIAVGSLFVDLVKSHAGITLVLAITAILSINLGAFNLLPIPALDGGRFVSMVIVEWLRKCGLSMDRIRKWEGMIHASGFILLLILSVFVAFHDIGNLNK